MNELIKLLMNLPGMGHYNLYGTLRHPIKAFFIDPYYEIKWFIQRGRRGYSDRDSWGIDYYLNSWMPKALRGLKNGSGFPVQIYIEMFPKEDWAQMNEGYSAMAHAQWHTILEEMAQGFEAAKKIESLDFKGPEELTMYERQLSHGLDLFKHYYLNLWD